MSRPTPAKSPKRSVPPHLLAHVFTTNSAKAKAMGAKGGVVHRSKAKK
jgi:hypothetical protein